MAIDQLLIGAVVMMCSTIYDSSNKMRCACTLLHHLLYLMMMFAGTGTGSIIVAATAATASAVAAMNEWMWKCFKTGLEYFNNHINTIRGNKVEEYDKRFYCSNSATHGSDVDPQSWIRPLSLSREKTELVLILI